MCDLDKDLRVQNILNELDSKLRRQCEDEFKSKPIAEQIGHVLGILLMVFFIGCLLHLLK